MSQIIMKNTFATFADPAMAEKAGGALLDHGVKAEHINIVFPEGFRSLGTADVGGGKDIERTTESGITTTTIGDAAGGSAKGAGIGLAAGTLAALAAVFVPGVGLVLGGGALALAIGGVAGTTVAGAVAGGVTGFLKDQGVPADSIAHYDTVLKSGGAMIAVWPTDETIDVATIESIITKYGGSISTYPQATSAVVMVEIHSAQRPPFGSPKTDTTAEIAGGRVMQNRPSASNAGTSACLVFHGRK
jgi:hypothetical protein